MGGFNPADHREPSRATRLSRSRSKAINEFDRRGFSLPSESLPDDMIKRIDADDERAV
jgi:hypothetical protein